MFERSSLFQAIILGPSSYIGTTFVVLPRLKTQLEENAARLQGWGMNFTDGEMQGSAWKEPKFRSKVIYFFTVQRLKIKDWQSWFIIFWMFLLQPWTCWDSSLFFWGVGIDSCCGKKPSPGYFVLKVCRVRTVQYYRKKHNPQMLNVLGCPRKLGSMVSKRIITYL